MDAVLNSTQALTRRVRVVGAARRSSAVRYAFAAAASVLALVLTSWARPILGHDLFLLLYASVTLSAWYGGLGAGLLATLLTVLGADVILVPPHSAFGLLDPAEGLRVAVFILVAALVSSTSESLRRASERAQRRTAEAAGLADELRDNAAELARQVAESRALALELEAAQRALRESAEARLAEAQRIAHLGSWEWDVENDALTWSDEMFRVHGLVPGSPPPSYRVLRDRLLHPDDRALFDAAIRHSLSSGEPFEFEHGVIRPDGTVRRLQARGGVVRDATGAPVRMLGTAQDITKRRATEEEARRAEVEAAARRAAEASERRYRLLFQESPLPAGIYDVETLRFLDVNETAVRHYGWSREEFLAMTLRDVRPPEEAPHFERAHAEIRAGRTRYRGTFVHRRKDGSPLVVEVSTQEVDLPDSRARLALITDVTERAGLLEAERRARAEAEEANRAKFEFLTTMSHELRTPLNAIGGYAQLLEMELRGPVTDAQREDLRRIQRSQRHLLSLINDVLNFARIETGHVHYAIDALSLADALADVDDLVTPQARAKGLSCDFAAPDPSLVVRADRDKLVQVVVNLLSNAVKFTPPGGRIALACVPAEDAVEVRVSDTGVGIADDKLETIFEPFVQVGRSYTRTTEGTGLGLAISRDLARAMGGDIRAESEVGKGSCFVLRLPREAQRRDRGAPATAQSAS